MRRFVSLAVLLLFAIPFGVSISGCSKTVAPTYCNGQTSGVQVGQLASLDLEPRLTGISLNSGEIGRVNAPSGKDCRGNSASANNVVYASTNIQLADVAPTTGSLCAGTWNRNTGASIPDYTVCTPAQSNGVAFVTTSADGVVSNPIPVFVHPIVTSIVLGPASTNCTTDPASNCINLDQPSVCYSGTPPATSIAAYDGNSCVSQGSTRQLVTRSYMGNGTATANNISCLVGPPQFSALNAAVVTVDANGVATAAQPGASTISANSSNASSTAGFFSTCPPASIVLSAQNQPNAATTPVSVNQNTTQALTATVLDANIDPANGYPLGHPITNIQLEYVSTNPTTVPAGSASVTPVFPGAAAITAICQPPTCNTAPFNEIGLFNNGTPVISNPVLINAVGTNFSTVLYIASTQSQYLLPVDFTASSQSAPVRLPYAPNSMVISEDLSTIYMGTSYEIMGFSTASNTLTKQDTSIIGTVLSVSPDNSTVVVTDPSRNLTYLYLSAGGISSEYGGIATRASWTPDSQTVYITTTDGRLLVHSSFTGWTAINLTTPATDVAVTVPSAGAYLGGSPVDVRTNCPATTINNPNQGFAQTTNNNFYPDLGAIAANATRLTATNDGVHILGASTTAFTDIKTNQKSGACPVTFTSSPGTPLPFTLAKPSFVSNVLATSDSAFAFVTYTGTGGVVPQYASATGTLSNIALQKTSNGTPTAPVSGVISADNNTLFVGTSGDNLVHRLTRGASGFTDTAAPIVPALPNINGSGTATPDLLVQHPRKSTS